MKTVRLISLVLVAVILSAIMMVSATALIGDVSNNNKVDGKDYMMIKRYALGTFEMTEEQLAVADVNGDNKVNGKDYMMVKRVVLGTYSFEEDPTIKAIKSALETKGELSSTFPQPYLNYEGVATVAFKNVNGVLTLCGHLEIASLGAVVDISIPMANVSSSYKFSGTANQVNMTFEVSGNLAAKNYSLYNKEFDIKIKQTAGTEISGIDDVLAPLCKTAMDEFLMNANDLLVDNNVGVTIADLGFMTLYDELNPSFGN